MKTSAPPISRALVEYLTKVYSPAVLRVTAEAPPHEIAAYVHREMGVQQVVSHIKAVYEQQQLEDPLANVHEDPEDT